MKHALCKALLPLMLAASQAAHADDLADAASAELALSRNPSALMADASLRPTARAAESRSMTTPKGAAATLYPPPPGFKTPKTNPARARDIYKSPY